MNLRWLLGNFADPQYKLSPAEQRELSRLAHERHVSGVRFALWTLLVVVAPTLILIKFALPVTLSWLGLSGRNVPYIIGAAVIVLLFWPWSAWAYRRLYVKPMRLAMREQGHDVCVECGYLLTGLDDRAGACPECGGSLEPRA